MKVRIEKLSDREVMRTLDNLYTAASSLKGREATKLFLKDLLTLSERIMLGRRIIIARKLLKGENYREISYSLGVGHDTIMRVEKWLQDQMPGYEKVIEKMERELLVIKLSLKRQKTKKVKLNQLVNKISSKAKPIETTSLIREMRNRNYE